MRFQLTLASVIVIILSFFIIFVAVTPAPTKPFVSSAITNSAYFDPKYFYPGIYFAKKRETSFYKKPTALIIPHHLIGSAIIADVLSAASKYHYDHIFLIGPNHRELGFEKLIVADTPANNEIISSDHSIGNPMLFINYYFPRTPVKNFLIKHDASLEDISTWTKKLVSPTSANILYIFSLDFSHYLPANDAAEKDRLTESLIASGNISRILTLNNDYVDSPSGLALCLSITQKLTANNPRLIHHTNSGYLLSDLSSGTTSYFGLAFFKKSN